MVDQMLRFIGEVVLYGGGAAAVAYLIFQFLGKSWIENKFAQKLEEFKHQQAVEIQKLRVEVDSMLSGVLKLQEKEFETLPEAWRKLDLSVPLCARHMMLTQRSRYAEVQQKRYSQA